MLQGLRPGLLPKKITSQPKTRGAGGKKLKISPRLLVGILVILLIPGLIGAVIPMLGNAGSSSNKQGSKLKKAYEISYGSTFNSYYECLDKGDEVWFGFVAPEEGGNAVISIDEIDGCSYDVSIYEKKKEQTTTYQINGDYETTYYLTGGKQYYIKVSFPYSYKDYGFNVTVDDPAPMGATRENAYELTAGAYQYGPYESLTAQRRSSASTSTGKGGEVAIMDKNYSNFRYNYVWFKFTPSQSGEYNFSIGTDARIEVYRGENESSMRYGTGNGLSCDLDSYTTYYVKVSFNEFSSSRPVSFQVGVNNASTSIK